MKKHYLLIRCSLLIICFSSSVFAQKEERFPLSDAVKYSQLMGKNDTIQMVAILNAYSENFSMLKKNKFIYVPELDSKYNSSKIIPAEIYSSQAGVGNPLGAPLIDALGTIIAKRFKEELTLAFLNSFRAKLKYEPYLGSLFPNTKLILLNEDPFNHKVWLSSFRGALDEDLRKLPDNLPELLKEIRDHANLNQEQVVILDALLAAYTPALELIRNPEKSYSSISNFLKNIKDVDFANDNISASLTLSYILIKELGNVYYSDWAKKVALENMYKPNISKTFIGFTIEKYENILKSTKININTPETNLYDLFHSDTFSKVNDYTLYLGSIVSQINSIQQTINTLKGRSGTSQLTFNDYTPLINQSLETIELLTDEELLKIIYPKAKQSDKLMDIVKYTNATAKFANKLYVNIQMKDYSKIIVNSLSFITEFIPDSIMDSSIVLREFVKYAELAVNMAGATTSEEMVKAIEGAALPAQSYRLKRNSYFSISINSYAGVFYAQEILLNKEAKNDCSGVTGFTAPIGIGFNWGIGKSKKPTTFSKYPTKIVVEEKAITQKTITQKTITQKTNYFKGHSISVFATLVDVGAITTFRLTDDQTPVDNIQWQNIFSPGAYIVWGIGNSPMALSIGGQYGPELRTVTAKDGVATPTIDSSAWRFGISLTVDIPFFHLYTKTEKITVKKDKTRL